MAMFQSSQLVLKWGKTRFIDKSHDNSIFWVIGFWIIGMSLISFAKTSLILMSATWLTRGLHSKMVFRLLHARVIEFIQRVPSGIIVNRFSSDINEMDNSYPSMLDLITSLGLGLIVLGMIVIFGAKNLFLLIPPILFVLIGLKLRKDYMGARRELTRLAFVSKSPVIGLAASCVRGAPIIRCLGLEGYFRRKIDKKINENTSTVILNEATNPWFMANISIYQCIVLLFPSFAILIYSIYYAETPGVGGAGAKHGKDKDVVNLANYITRVEGFANIFALMLIFICLLETYVVSAERCVKFEELESEEGYLSMERDVKLFEFPKKMLKEATRFISTYKKEASLADGSIRIENLSITYPTNNKTVLKNISLKIESGQKVGIVGRSGAGKSTFVKALWRAFESYQGNIFVGGKNIIQMDLKNYREQLNVILQKPNLFEGTLQSNITPRRLDSQQRIALKNELIQLGFPESRLHPHGLEFNVAADGANLSQSEKQTVCLLQALNHKAKLVILDEATAYVDLGMERRFQKAIKSKFEDSTLLVVAHRISNVMECDRVLLFADGEIVEDGDPRELVKDVNGKFYEIWKEG